jgi:hypothetical protein
LCCASELVGIAGNGELTPIEAEAQPDERHSKSKRPVPEEIEIEEKRELVKDIYEAMLEAYPFPPDHRIYMREWTLGSVNQDGQLGLLSWELFASH